MFPGAPFPGMGPSPGATALDGPPPSPTPMSGPPPGGPGGAPFSMRGIAGPGGGPAGIPSQGMPPEVLTGITQSAQAMGDLIDSWAQITPDQAPQLSMIKDLVQQYLATLMGSGAGPTAPTAAGPAFPGGGMDQGLPGAGSV
jgi:hypothetical protein